ncbi:MAG: selenocysteine-specific translation elongation factor [Anaerolineales bacterium]|nr:selenocysteine-specific translation elongation factor [Anaerolineales bacterium]
MFVVGTAGHVDHGKSTLVQALTGIDPDRLKEEKEREMTIDLGFAWVTLPDGETIGIVDVPGHRDFIENMLAGVGGIDAALMIIAADEGVMPQTREHLTILDLLEVKGGVVALTKTDMIDDPEWVDLVTLDVTETLEGTVLENAPVIPVSARTGAGLPVLAQALADCLAGRPPRPDYGRPRLPIDRVFTLSGFGTVVTGTLIDGTLSLGETVEVQPGGLGARIRGLQTHKKKIELATPGSRVAVNLTGLGKDEVERGRILTIPGWLKPTLLVDVDYRHMPDTNKPLQHNTPVKFFSGAAEVQARTRVLGQEQILPGERGWLQLQLEKPIALVKGDHFIIRQPSPGQTLGGGVVVDPAPRRRHRRFRTEIIERLEVLARGTPSEIILQTLETLGPQSAATVAKKSGLETKEVSSLVTGLVRKGQVVPIGNNGPMQLLMAKTRWNALVQKARDQLGDYHRANPLKPGMVREELKSRLRLSSQEFNGFMDRISQEGELVEEGIFIRLDGHQICFSPEQQQAADKLLARFRSDPFGTPSYKECVQAVGDNVLSVLTSRGELIQVSSDVLFDAGTVQWATDKIRAYIEEHGSITVAQARDLFNSSRKYVLSLLEYLDQQNVTRREGDERVFGSRR